MIWAIYALYEQAFGRVRYPGGLSICFTSTIRVKQGYEYMFMSVSSVNDLPLG